MTIKQAIEKAAKQIVKESHGSYTIREAREIVSIWLVKSLEAEQKKFKS